MSDGADGLGIPARPGGCIVRDWSGSLGSEFGAQFSASIPAFLAVGLGIRSVSVITPRPIRSRSKIPREFRVESLRSKWTANLQRPSPTLRLWTMDPSIRSWSFSAESDLNLPIKDRPFELAGTSATKSRVFRHSECRGLKPWPAKSIHAIASTYS